MSDPALPRLVTEFDWSRTPLGDPARWPQSLHTVAKLVLSSAFPMILLWGRDLIQIYNDGYAVIMAERHPAGLGQPTRECWPEVWHINEPIYDRVWQGETFYFENQLYPLTRKGFVEEAYFTLCYSPVREDGHIGGVLVTITETTAQVLGQRRIEALRAHAEALAPVQTLRALQRLANAQPAQPDVPFTQLYLTDRDSLPPELLLVVETRNPLELNWSVGGMSPQPALALPVDGAERASGVLVLGLNPRVPLDDAYRSFLESYARQVSAAFVRIKSQEQYALNRKLEDERAALTAFAQFTEAASRTSDTAELARLAGQVLDRVLSGVDMAFAVQEHGHWQVKVVSGDIPTELLARIEKDIPAKKQTLPPVFMAGQPLFLNWGEPFPPEFKLAAETYPSAALYPVRCAHEPCGLLTLGLREARPWTARERSVILAVGLSLELAFQRVNQTRRLAEERDALAAFVAFMEAVGTDTDVHAIVRHAIDVLRVRYPQSSVLYYEPEGELWRAKVWSEDISAEMLQGLCEGISAQHLFIAEVLSSHQPNFLNHWDAEQQGLLYTRAYQAGANIPLVMRGEVQGILGLGDRQHRHWQERDKTRFRAVGRGLTLALERAEHTRRLSEEREALAVFARFTEKAGQHRDLPDLVAEAADLLQSVLHVRSAAYFELQANIWRARHIAHPLNPEIAQVLRAGVSGDQPDLAGPHQRHEITFLEHWDAAAQGTPAYNGYKALARYPLYPKDHAPGLLGMAKVDPTWTEREKAVFRAVGDSLRLAVERAEMLRQVEMQRQRLADLNAELSVYITRTAHTLEIPAQYLSMRGNSQENAATFDPHLLQDELVRLNGVAQDLRQLSALEEQHLHPDFVPLNELLQEVQAELTGPERVVEWRIKPLPIVRGDRELFSDLAPE